MTIETMAEMLNIYSRGLIDEELCQSTVLKYIRDIQFFLRYNKNKQEICKKDMMEYKDYLLNSYKINTVNSYLISVNRYLSWLGCGEMTTKTVKMQRKTSLNDIITREEYGLMLNYCLENGKIRDYLLLRTIACTGIRVGELKYITYDAVSAGKAEILIKNKCRTIYITEEISQQLISQCSQLGIKSGVIFKGRSDGSPIQPKSVWKLLKRIAESAGVDSRKAYPHNLRHLFAKTYMQKIGNIFELADLMGHSSIETTRIYALSSCEEKRESLGKLEL